MNKVGSLCLILALSGCASTSSDIPLDNVKSTFEIQGSINDLFSASQECLVDIIGQVPRENFDYMDEERKRFSIRIKFTQAFPTRFGYSGNHESTFSIKVREDNKLEVSERNIAQWNNMANFWGKVYKGSDTENIINSRANKLANCVRDVI
jgi:hypothetical protein